MRQVLLGLVGMIAAGAAWAENYIFVAVIQGAYQEQTSIQCDGPRVPGRVPTGCILSDRAIAYPNYQMPTRSTAFLGVACAAGHPIAFYPNGTLAECVLDAEPPVDVTGLGFKMPLGDCKGRVRFDKNGRVEC